VKVTGKEPGTFMEIKGQSCTYGVTLIDDAPNPDAAIAFLQYLLDPRGGLKTLKEMGQPPFVPARVPDADMDALLPEGLRKFVEVKN
jgi:molybdate/tungstate transport system substrate-binding protein